MAVMAEHRPFQFNSAEPSATKKEHAPHPRSAVAPRDGFLHYLSKGMGLSGGVTPHHSPISPPDPPAYPPGSVQLFSLK